MEHVSSYNYANYLDYSSLENGKYYAVNENKIIDVNDSVSIRAFADIPSNVYKVGITVDTPYGYGRCSAFVDSEGKRNIQSMSKPQYEQFMKESIIIVTE